MSNTPLAQKEVNARSKVLHRPRGRLAAETWQNRARYVLRSLGNPILQARSPICRSSALQRLAKARYPNGIVAGGRALNDILLESLSEIENELQNQPRLTKLKAFVALTREGKGVTEASRAIGVTPEYASRHLKRLTVELLGEKLKQKLH